MRHGPSDCDRLQFWRDGRGQSADESHRAVCLEKRITLPILKPCFVEGDVMHAVFPAPNRPWTFALGWDGPKGPPSAPPAIPPIIINPFSYHAPSPAIDPRLPPMGPPIAPPPGPRQRL
jgi:hypothetical protein